MKTCAHRLPCMQAQPTFIESLPLRCNVLLVNGLVRTPKPNPASILLFSAQMVLDVELSVHVFLPRRKI